jgi:hypothetical protein
VNPLLDTAPETYPEWGHMRTTLTQENMGHMMHLRVELQTLYRLPRSNAICFDIRAYLGKFEELVTVPKWGRRLHRVVRDLHPDLAAYKGFLRNRDAMAQWLSQYDDGQPTSPGWWPED